MSRECSTDFLVSLRTSVLLGRLANDSLRSYGRDAVYNRRDINLGQFVRTHAALDLVLAPCDSAQIVVHVVDG
jgi:hypothetical protein